MLILLDFVSNFKNTLDIGDIIIDVILIVGDDVMVDNGSNDEQQLFFSLSLVPRPPPPPLSFVVSIGIEIVYGKGRREREYIILDIG